MATHLTDQGTISIIGKAHDSTFIVACTGGHGWVVQAEPFEPEVSGRTPSNRMLSRSQMRDLAPEMETALGLE